MLDTQEKFTKRFQFDRMSHNLLSKTPTNQSISGSANNDITKYESKTIFRNGVVMRNKSSLPMTYSAMLGNKSPSLPSIQRTSSGTHHRRTGMSKFEHDKLARSQRPTSTHMRRQQSLHFHNFFNSGKGENHYSSPNISPPHHQERD